MVNQLYLEKQKEPKKKKNQKTCLDWEKITASHISRKGLIFKAKKMNSKFKNFFKLKCTNNLNSDFSMKIVKKVMSKAQHSLLQGKNKTIRTYHYTTGCLNQKLNNIKKIKSNWNSQTFQVPNKNFSFGEKKESKIFWI